MPRASRQSNTAPLHVFTGDWHALSDSGLCCDDFIIPSKKKLYVLSPEQEWLYECFMQDVSAIKKIMKEEGRKLVLHIGGDSVDGVQHHGTITTTGTRKDQREAAIKTIQPLANVASAVYGLEGTPAHVGEESEEDYTVVEALGGRTKHQWRLDCSGRLLDWAHSGISVSKRPSNNHNGMISIAVDTAIVCGINGIRKPDLMVSHHVHVAPDPVTVRGITVAICPAYQLPGSYVHSFAPRSQPSIGMLLWRPDIHKVDVLRHVQPDDIEVVHA